LEIRQKYSIIEIESSTKVSIKHIKICRRKHKIIKFDFRIIDEDWDDLLYHLRKKDNKILGLDFTSPGIDKYFHKFLDKMREPYLYIYWSYLYFGTTQLGSRKLIKLAGFFVSYYSEHAREYPSNMFNYLVL